MKYAIVENGVVVNVAKADAPVAPNWIESDTAGIGWTYDGETFTEPEPLTEPVPAEVTRRQAKQALVLAGLLGNVQPAIDAIEDATQRALIQIEWDDSQVFQRDRPALIALATALGLDSAGIDALFTTAAGIP